jgi:hypothetical protein
VLEAGRAAAGCVAGILNSDQGSPFTSAEWIGAVQAAGMLRAALDHDRGNWRTGKPERGDEQKSSMNLAVSLREEKSFITETFLRLSPRHTISVTCLNATFDV